MENNNKQTATYFNTVESNVLDCISLAIISTEPAKKKNK
jgi:hypothetical protein